MFSDDVPPTSGSAAGPRERIRYELVAEVAHRRGGRIVGRVAANRHDEIGDTAGPFSDLPAPEAGIGCEPVAQRLETTHSESLATTTWTGSVVCPPKSRCNAR